MAFSFGFGGYDDDGSGEEEEKTVDNNNNRTSTTIEASQGSGATTSADGLVAPHILNIDSLLDSLPSSLQFRQHKIPVRPGADELSNDRPYPRRELHDIRAQVMAETDLSSVDQVLEASLSGHGDLSSGIYEGGFKTWECSYDVASRIQCDLASADDGTHSFDFVELGAGTALPSSVMLRHLLKREASAADGKPQTLVVADYNEAVLRLASLPNLVLTWYETFHSGTDASSADEGYLEVTAELKQAFKQDLAAHAINLVLVAGSWGTAFTSLVSLTESSAETRIPRGMLIAASETVYAPGTIHIFTQTLLDLLSMASTRRSVGSMDTVDTQQPPTRALVAAKQIYFGVGGGVDEFKKVLAGTSGSIVDEWFGGRGVGRWIGQVEHA